MSIDPNKAETQIYFKVKLPFIRVTLFSQPNRFQNGEIIKKRLHTECAKEIYVSIRRPERADLGLCCWLTLTESVDIAECVSGQWRSRRDYLNGLHMRILLIYARTHTVDSRYLSLITQTAALVKLNNTGLVYYIPHISITLISNYYYLKSNILTPWNLNSCESTVFAWHSQNCYKTCRCMLSRENHMFHKFITKK